MSVGIFRSLCAATLLAFAAQTNAALIISEVVDGERIAADGSVGTFSNGDPNLAFVELTNTGTDVIPLGGVGLQNFNNGNSTSSFSSVSLTGNISPGSTYYIAYEASDPGNTAFFRTYGFEANVYTGSKFVNGDDVLMLFEPPYPGGNVAVNAADVIDVYGVLGEDGSGEDWEYQDTYASRLPSVTTGSSTFDIAEWTIGGVNDLDGEDAAGHIAVTSVTEPVPEPGSFLLILLGTASAGAARMRFVLG